MRRHARLMVVLAALGSALGVGWALVQPSAYSATASVVLTPVPKYATSLTSGRPPSLVTIDSDAQLVQSAEVLEAVAEAAPGPGDVAERVHVTATPLSRVLHIRFTAPSATAAAAGATAAAEALVDARRETLGALSESEVDQLRLRIRELEDELAVQQSRRLVVLQRDPLAIEIAELRERLLVLERAQDVPAEVIREPVPPSAPDRPNAEVPIVSGAMAGLLVGWTVGTLRDRRPQRRPSSNPQFFDGPPGGD